MTAHRERLALLDRRSFRKRARAARISARWPFVLLLALVAWWGGEERQHRLHPTYYAAGYADGREDEGRAAIGRIPYIVTTGDSVRVLYWTACRREQ